MHKEDPIFNIKIRNKEKLKEKCALYTLPLILMLILATQLHNGYRQYPEIWNGTALKLFPTERQRIIHAHLINQAQIHCIQNNILNKILIPDYHLNTTLKSSYLKKSIQRIANKLNAITFRHGTKRVDNRIIPTITPLKKNEELLTEMHRVKYTHIELDIWQLSFNRKKDTLSVQSLVNKKIAIE